MRVLLVDDEPLALRRLEIMLGRRPWVEIVGVARDGACALDAISELHPDLVFLDIQMPGVDGLEIADLLRDGPAPEIVFVTAFDTYAVRAFEASATDYLLKPVESDRLDEALGRARTHLAARDAKTRADELEALVRTLRGGGGETSADLWIKDRRGSTRLEKSRIDWIEAEGDYVRIHVADRSWLLRETMAAMEKQLDPRMFARVHRSAIVNLRSVERAAATPTRARILQLSSGAQVRVGRAYESKLNALMARSAY